MNRSKTNLLFLCSHNQWRSPTAERIFRDKGFNTRSAGTKSGSRKTVTMADIDWADYIFVMEKKHKVQMFDRFGKQSIKKPVHILEVPDHHRFMDPELIEVLEIEVGLYLD